MNFNSHNIIEICNINLSSFRNSLEGINYEKGGIYNSEMLLFVSLIKHFGVNLIIESGRARGQSTKVIAENFKDSDYKIFSIEYNKYSSDVRISKEKLQNYKNINLLFGDSFKILPPLITEKCYVLIDGPKRVAAIQLAIESLKNPLVKAVFIHDLYKDSPHRKVAEKIFNDYFFTDNKNYVNIFKSLDINCWIEQRKYRETQSWGPYKRGKKKFKSYAPTLLVIFNSENAFNLKEFTNHINEIKLRKKSWKLKYILNGWPKRLSNILKFPSYYIYSEKVINHKENINLIDMMLKWVNRTYLNIRNLTKKRVSYYLIEKE